MTLLSSAFRLIVKGEKAIDMPCIFIIFLHSQIKLSTFTPLSMAVQDVKMTNNIKFIPQIYLDYDSDRDITYYSDGFQIIGSEGLNGKHLYTDELICGKTENEVIHKLEWWLQLNHQALCRYYK